MFRKKYMPLFVQDDKKTPVPQLTVTSRQPSLPEALNPTTTGKANK
jgi:hypothetical protein